MGIINIVLLALIITLVVTAVRRRRTSLVRPETSESTVRRLFVYGILFAAGIVTAMGATGLFGSLMGSAEDRTNAEIAAPLSMVIVGGAVLYGLARWISRIHATDVGERHSFAWSLYVNAMLVVSLTVTGVMALGLTEGIIDGEWRGMAAAGTLVWGGLWSAHWHTWRRVPPTTGPRTHLWLGSILGLWTVAVTSWIGLGGLVELTIADRTDLTTAVTADQLWFTAVAAALGAAVWGWHWLLHGARTPSGTGWLVTVLLFGMLPGLAVAVATSGYALYLVVLAALGEIGDLSTSAQLLRTAMPLAGTLVGLVVWSYHRRLLGRPDAPDRNEIHRTGDYLIAGVGIATVAVSVAMLVMAAFAAVADLPGRAAEIRVLVAALTLGAVGLPVWLVAWRRLQGLAAAIPAERSSRVRRSYLLAIFGVSGAVAFGATISFLIGVLSTLFGEQDASALPADLQLPTALIVATTAIAGYHWNVYRSERTTVPHSPVREVLLVDGRGFDVRSLEDRIDGRVRLLHRLDAPDGPDVSVEQFADAIEHADGRRLLVLAGPRGVDVIPYE